MGTGDHNAGGNLAMDQHPIQGGVGAKWTNKEIIALGTGVS